MVNVKVPKKYVKKNSRHIRWNWEESLDNLGFVRYHLIIVDDKDREGILKNILENLHVVNGGVLRIRSVSGKVKGTRYRYLFETHDSRTAPDFINWSLIKKDKVRDKNLYERKKGNIEDYVSSIYDR